MVKAGGWESLAVATTGVLALAYLSKSKPKAIEIPKKEHHDEVVVTMLPLETSDVMMQNISSISTITWYKGDIDTIQESLRNRITDILRANPWIGGRLEKRRNKNGAMVPSLIYCANTEKTISKELDIIYKCYNGDKDEIPLTRDIPYEQLTTILQNLLVKNSFNLLDKEDGALFRISLVPDYKDLHGYFALVVSLAHCIGDGQTYYSLHNMLDMKHKVVSLNVQRKQDITERIETALGGPAQASSLSNPSPGFVARFLAGLTSSILFGPPTSVKVFAINEEWIQQQKQIAMESDPNKAFVSTNDIVTSNFFQCVDCDQGIMAINFRGKVKDCLGTDAGNYFNFLVYRPADYSSPRQIRSTVHELQTKGKRQPITKPMTSWEHFRSKRQFGACSNWSSFCKPVGLGGGCIQDLHMPLLPTDPISVPSNFTSVLVIFRPGKSNRIAAMFAGHPKALETLIASDMVGKDVYRNNGA